MANILCTRSENIQASLIFFARLFVYLKFASNILPLALKNIQASLIFFARLFVYLQ